MGAVYRAIDTETRQEVALKVLTAEMAAKPGMVKRFRREGESALQLQHENIVKVFEYSTCGGTSFIAMEFVDGIDLLDYIDANGPLDPEESRQIMIQACRALKHAYEHGIVHRDIKPSNFLVAHKKGRLIVKLTDLGLARQPSTEDFRVTRSGTTVGTVDYMAPEQARDSGLADTRSDLYALGCTWFHMLAKEPPFPAGGLAERILKHLEQRPPDVRGFNPRASKALTRVLNRLLEKKQEDRYQTPADLLDDLLSLDAIARPKIRKAKYDPDASDEMPARAARRPSRVGRAGKTDRMPTKLASRRSRRGRWIAVSLAAALFVAVVGSVGLAFALKDGAPDAEKDSNDNVVAATMPVPQRPVPTVTPIPTKEKVPEGKLQQKVQLPALYEPRTPIDLNDLRARIDGPWASVAEPPAGAPVLHVSRTRPVDGPTMYPSLAEACAAAVPGQATIIEIQDNGPLYHSAVDVGERKVFIRAAKGYRPLIVWDVSRTLQERKTVKGKTEPLALFQVDGGQLSLEGVDVVAKWTDSTIEPVALLMATNGDLDVLQCTFSVAGRNPDGVAWVRFVSRKGESSRCRLRNCYARGGCLIGLDIDAPRAEVLLAGCLVVGGTHPLVQVHAGPNDPATLRIVRSTLVAAQSFLKMHPVPADEHEPALRLLAWDSVLSRSNDQIGGEMVSLPDNVLTRKMRWEVVGCLYAGWQKLLGGSNPIGLERRGLIAWDVAWGLTEGDRAVEERFPAAAFTDPAQLPAANYVTAQTPLAYASTSDAHEPLGCVIGELPTTRDNWLGLTYDRFPVPDGDVLSGSLKPEIDVRDQTTYSGARLEVTGQLDLGAYLQEVQRQRPLAKQVVLLLSGSGEQRSSPIKIKGSSLVLYFEQSARDDVRPLSLVSKNAATDAFIEVEDGSLDVVNADLALPDSGKTPSNLLKVSGGDMHLHRTRLRAPHQPSAEPYDGLVVLQGSGATGTDKARACLINESILSSGQGGIRLCGVGARLLFRQSVLLAGADAVRVEPGAFVSGQFNTQCVFEQSTLAAKRAVVHLEGVATAGPVVEPVVVRTENSAFLNPFAEPAAKPGLLLCDGDTLTRGLVVWQSEGDFLDRRLPFGVLPASGIITEVKSWQAAWPLLWGTVAVRRPATDIVTARSFDGNVWTLDRLSISPSIATKKRPGVDFGLLGLDKKKAAKPL
jgi:hypothetical protein